MTTGSPGALGSAASHPLAHKHVGDLAGLFAELREMTPEHLRKIETQVAELYAAHEAAEKAQHEAEQAQRKAELAQQELGKGIIESRSFHQPISLCS